MRLYQDEFIAHFLRRLEATEESALTVQEVAAILNIHPDTVRDYIVRGELKAARNKRQYLIAKKWVAEFLTTYNASILSSTNNFNMKREQRLQAVLEYCLENPRSYQELLTFTGLGTKEYLQRVITRPLMRAGLLALLYPERPHYTGQRYFTIKHAYAAYKKERQK